MNFADTKQLLQQYYYKITSENLPEPRKKSEWKPENNLGFLLGLIAFGIDTHITQLHNLLHNNQFKEQEQSFIDTMLDFYIRPFHKSYNNDSEYCRTPSVSSKAPSGRHSTEDSELAHEDLKRDVLKRDVVCLFCWNKLSCEGAHIIAQKNIPMAYDEPSLLQRAGLTSKHQVQNGLLLCKICHDQFDLLRQYVDVVDDKLVVKVVNGTNDETNPDWIDAVETIKDSRSGKQRRVPQFRDRLAVESNGEMALYFVNNNASILPNRNALEFHKTACLIWRMAGGAESDEEYCSDDEQGPVDTAALRKRFNLPAEDSSSTLNQIA